MKTTETVKKVKILNILFLCIFVTFVQNMSAQDDEDTKIIYLGDDKDLFQEEREIKLIFKTNPISSLVGKQFLEVEYLFNNRFTMSGGLGPTFSGIVSRAITESPLNIFAFSDELFICDSPNFPNSDICDPITDEFRDVKLGFYSALNGKVYLRGNAPRGAYISVNFMYSTGNFESATMVLENGVAVRNLDVLQEENLSRFDATFRLGIQEIYETVAFEFFVGLGQRRVNAKYLDAGYSIEVNDIVNLYHDYKYKAVLPEVGIRVGIPLYDNDSNNRGRSNDRGDRRKSKKRGKRR